MSFLLDRETCSAWVRKNRFVYQRFFQNLGNVHLSAMTVLGLELWLLRKRTPSRYLQVYGALMQQLKVVEVDESIAHRAAIIGSDPSTQGRPLDITDLLVAATALVRGLTLVTHQGQRFANVAGLNTVDWMVP
jgi:tRNA(fMet)-specific endonuclease VapC